MNDLTGGESTMEYELRVFSSKVNSAVEQVAVGERKRHERTFDREVCGVLTRCFSVESFCKDKERRRG